MGVWHDIKARLGLGDDEYDEYDEYDDADDGTGGARPAAQPVRRGAAVDPPRDARARSRSCARGGTTGVAWCRAPACSRYRR